MDYIVFGTGYGATLMVLGWALRTFGPGVRYRDAGSDSPASADVLVYRVSWRRFSQALGAVLAAAGAAVILVTFLTALVNPGDHAGAITLRICFALVIVGVAVWTWFYVARYGAEGLVPGRLDIGRLLAPRERPFRAAESSPASTTTRAPESAGAESAASAGIEQDAPAAEEMDDGLAAYDADDDMEMAARYARYQVHHPDEPRDSGYQDLFAMYATPESQEEDVEVMVEATDPQAPGSGSDTGDLAGEMVDPGIVTEEPEPAEAPEEDDETHESGPEDVPVTDEPDGDALEDEEGGEAAFDPDAPLTDTPEGRAEALRRIQAWDPDENA